MDNQIAKTQNQATKTQKVGRITVEQSIALRNRAEILLTRQFEQQDVPFELAEKVVNGLCKKLYVKLSSGDIIRELREFHRMTSREVATHLVHQWLKFDCKDPYTGLPLNLWDFEFEHIEGYTANGSIASCLDNVVLIDQDLNQTKGDIPLEQFIERIFSESLTEVAEKRLASESKLNTRETLKASVIDDVKSLTPENVDQMIAKYGKYDYHLNRAVGLRIGFAMYNSERPRTARWARKVGKVNVGHEVLRCFVSLDQTKQQELREGVDKLVLQLVEGKDKLEVNKEILAFARSL